MKKIILPLLVLLPAAASLASCGGNGRDNTKTQIDIDSYTGGVGSKWLADAIDGFTKLKANISYEDGKMGVEIHPNYTKSIDTSSIKTNPKIFFTEDFGFPHDLAGQNALLDITDVVTGKAVDEGGEETATIESKIDADYSKLLQYNGKYFGLPHYEWYPGLTYNKDLFDGVTNANKCFYLSEEPTSYSTALPEGSSNIYYFVDKDELQAGTAKLTCGNDGEYGTSDDGLPSCLPEFIALCKYMNENEVKALICPGNHTDYTGHLLNGLVASLSTPEALKAYQSFEGKINYVASIGNDGNYLFDGSGLGTPTVVTNYELNKNQSQDRKDGYLTRQQVERYAATALLRYLVQNKDDYFFPTSYDGSTINRAAQQFFIENGFPGSTGSGDRRFEIGMMCEGNYWVNEARDDGGLFEVFESKNPGVKRHLGWMPLPVNILDPVKEGEGKTPQLLDTGNSYCMVSQAVKTNKGSVAAIKDFLRYLYSDSRLKAFTKTTGICKAAMKYDVASIETDMEFQKDVLNIKAANGVRNPGHDNAVFYKNRNDFSFSINYPIFRDKDNVCFFDAFCKNKSAKDCFNETTITEKDWIDKYLPKQ